MKKNESSPKMTGAIFVLIALLILGIGFMLHWIQVGAMPETEILPLKASQLNMLFAEYVAVGFLSALFLAFGIDYLRRSGGTVEIKEVQQ